MSRLRYTLNREYLTKNLEFDTAKPRKMKEDRDSKAQAAKTLIDYIVALNRKIK